MDAHCHIDCYDEPEELVEEIKKKNTTVFFVTNSPNDYWYAHMLSKSIPSIYLGVGVHPCAVDDLGGELTHLPEADFVGEIGLDGGKTFRHTWDKQVKVFNWFLENAKDYNQKILSIHSRQAAEDVTDILSKHEGVYLPILHWYSGSKTILKKAIEIGCWFSVGPAMIRGNKGKQLLAIMPIDRILLETDGPFTSHNGKAFYPWDALNICPSIIAQVKGIPLPEVHAQLERNLAIVLKSMNRNSA